MAGEDNLTPARSKEEARARGSNGGKRSGEVRREKKNFFSKPESYCFIILLNIEGKLAFHIAV